MADEMEKRLRAVEIAIHSQTIALRHLANDVRDLSQAVREIAYKIFPMDDIEPIPENTEAEKMLAQVFDKFSKNLYDTEARTSQLQSLNNDNE